jgi:hypothetical protein
MNLKCANPDCSALFDLRRGRLYRFPKSCREDGHPANSHSAQHFWLCMACCKSYTLKYDENLGVSIDHQGPSCHASRLRHFIAAA